MCNCQGVAESFEGVLKLAQQVTGPIGQNLNNPLRSPAPPWRSPEDLGGATLYGMKFLRYGFIQPSDWTCVPAATRLVLHNFGIKRTVSSIAKEMKTVRGGTTEFALTRFLKRQNVGFTIKRSGNTGLIRDRLKNGRMVLVSYWIPFYKEYHVAIVKKVTAKRIYFHDTWFGASHSYSLNYFIKNWKADSCWMLTVRI